MTATKPANAMIEVAPTSGPSDDGAPAAPAHGSYRLHSPGHIGIQGGVETQKQTKGLGVGAIAGCGDPHSTKKNLTTTRLIMSFVP